MSARRAELRLGEAGCPECRGDGYVVRRGGEVAVAAVCSCRAVCPDCKGTGFVAIAEGFRAARRRCDCGVLLGRVAQFNAAGIPARHADSTRAAFKTSNQQELVRVLTDVTRWLQNFDPEVGKEAENRGFVLWGGVGRGKTHLLVAVLRELVFRHGVSVRFVEFSHLLSDLKAGFDAGRSASDLLDPLVRVPILAIDELGKGRATDFEFTVLDEMVSRRYNAALPLLATTNFAPGTPTGRPVGNAAAPSGPAPTLGDRVGDRVYSRLLETCDFVEIAGEDWRARQQKRRGA